MVQKNIRINFNTMFDAGEEWLFDAKELLLEPTPAALERYSAKTLVDKFDELQFLSYMYRGLSARQEFVDDVGEVALVYQIQGAVCYACLPEEEGRQATEAGECFAEFLPLDGMGHNAIVVRNAGIA